MTKKRRLQDLYVYTNSIFVGALTRESSGSLVFKYDQNWLNLENAHPISLSMPLTEIPYKGYVVENYFDNLLPDSELIRERIQARFGALSKKCFELLSFIGTDCVGALQILTQAKAIDVKKIEAQPINDSEIANLLKHYQQAPLGMDRKFDFRISIAGAQEKTALLWSDEKWHLPQSSTPTSHIIKLPIGQIQHSGIDLSESVENEWLCLKILSAFNLPVNQANIVNFDDVKTLVVERFDRQWANNKQWLMRLPQEDFCQALGRPSGLKYQSDGGPGIADIMNLLKGSKEPTHNRQNFMRSVFLFWVLGAIDGHAKNFSITIEPQGRFQLTPLYDVISAYPLAAKKQIEWQALKMAMSVKSKNNHYGWNNIQSRHWLTMAQSCQFSVSVMQKMMDEICDTMENVISQVTLQLPTQFPHYIAESLFSGMRRIKNKCI